MISYKFTFDDTTSESMGVYLVRMSSGMFPISYVAGKEILEEYPSRASSPYFFRTKKSPYTMTLTFSTLSNDMDATKLKDIASWLIQDEYKAFVSDDNPDKIFYLMATNQIDFYTNGNNEGYFDITFRCQFPYALTSASTPTYEITSSGTITIENDSNTSTYYYPEIEITTCSTGIVSLVNTSDNNRTTSFTSLSNGLDIYMNGDKKQLITSDGSYIYDKFNKIWLRLVQGTNVINVTGNVIIEFRTQFPVFT
jgi:predicted phage tail component-like protein